MKKAKAFSLIEISIVLLIIGILVAGVTQSSRLMAQFKIQTAQRLTENSPVNNIKDLAMWLETSKENAVTYSSSDSSITSWNDINPQGAKKVNATGAGGSTAPTFVENSINGLPAVTFSAATYQSIAIDPSGNEAKFLAGTNYTIFVVERRITSGANTNRFHFLSGNGGAYSTNLQLGYNGDGFIWNDWGYDWNIALPTLVDATPRIHSMTFNSVAGKQYWLTAGPNTYYEAKSSHTIPLVSYAGARIGGSAGSIDGAMAEMIIFTRDLKPSERTAVEEYLKKKYDVKSS